MQTLAAQRPPYLPRLPRHHGPAPHKWAPHAEPSESRPLPILAYDSSRSIELQYRQGSKSRTRRFSIRSQSFVFSLELSSMRPSHNPAWEHPLCRLVRRLHHDLTSLFLQQLFVVHGPLRFRKRHLEQIVHCRVFDFQQGHFHSHQWNKAHPTVFSVPIQRPRRARVPCPTAPNHPRYPPLPFALSKPSAPYVSKERLED